MVQSARVEQEEERELGTNLVFDGYPKRVDFARLVWVESDELRREECLAVRRHSSIHCRREKFDSVT